MNAIFFPRKDYDVEICAHRLGKSMTYTDQTDGYNVIHGGINTFAAYMQLAKARNIRVGCFMGLSQPVTDTDGTIKADYNGNRLWLDAYSYTTELAEKITTGQVITQMEWESAYQNTILPNFFNFFGKKPVALSYSYGNDSFKDYVIPNFLGARNSIPSGDTIHNTFPTDYGVGYGNPNTEPYSINRYKSKASSMRWYDAAKEQGNNFTEQLAIVSQKIDETKINGGWLNNFTHWHNYWQDGNQQWVEPYLNLLQSKNNNNQIYFSGYGEAVAYLVFRQIITRAVMYSPLQHHNTQLIIRLETSNTLGVDTDLLQVPISVKFTLVGTPLAGMNIKSNRNLLALGNDDYLVEIPFGQFPYAVIEKI